MADERRILIASDADLVSAREEGRELAAQIGFSRTDATLIATAISEVARNILSYAGTGEINVAAVFENGRHGVTVVAADSGPGIEDVATALAEGTTSSGGLGMGLPGARRLMDDFKIDSELGKGTRVTMKKWRGSARA